MACSNNTNNDSKIKLTDINLSGSWKISNIEDIHHSETDEYLYSNISTETLIITDSDSGIRYSDCKNYGRQSDTPAIKTESNLYLYNTDTRFSVITNNLFVSKKELGIEHDLLTNRYINVQQKLERIETEAVIDKGLFILHEPVSVTEYTHVCLYHNYSTLYDDESFGLAIPYLEGEIYFDMRLKGLPKVKTHDYTPYENGAEIMRFSLYSNTDHFEEITGSSYANINAAEITITDSVDDNIAGIFQFSGNGDQNFSGEFQFEKSN